MNNCERDAKFETIMIHWPEEGAVMEALNNEASVVVETHGGRLTLRTAAVIDDDCTGWFLDKQRRGVVVLIDGRDHEILLAKYGSKPIVKRLQVLRHTAAGTAIVCELLEEDRKKLRDERTD